MSKYIKILNSKKKFEVNNVYCIGKNYFEHIKEFGGNKVPEKPVVFLKPNSSIDNDGKTIKIPEYNGKPISELLHYETEFVIAISKAGLNIPEEEAKDYILGYCIGLDLTLRDVQNVAKTAGLPWTLAKGFYKSAPVSDIILANAEINPMNLEFELHINNIRKQFTNTSEMIFNIYKLIHYISSIFSLCKGDLIFTGTPSGVGKINTGDLLEARLCKLLSLNLKVKY